MFARRLVREVSRHKAAIYTVPLRIHSVVRPLDGAFSNSQCLLNAAVNDTRECDAENEELVVHIDSSVEGNTQRNPVCAEEVVVGLKRCAE